MDNNDCVYFHGGTGRIQEGFQCASITVQALTKLNKKNKKMMQQITSRFYHRALTIADWRIGQHFQLRTSWSRFFQNHAGQYYALIILFILDLYRLYQFLALSSLLSSIYLKIQKVSKVLPFSVQVGAHLTGI